MEETAKLSMLFHLYQSNIAALTDLYKEKEERVNKEVVSLIEQSLLMSGRKILLEMGLVENKEATNGAEGKDSLI